MPSPHFLRFHSQAQTQPHERPHTWIKELCSSTVQRTNSTVVQNRQVLQTRLPGEEVVHPSGSVVVDCVAGVSDAEGLEGCAIEGIEDREPALIEP